MAAPLNLIAIPLVAGLAAGGGTLANYVGGPTTAPIEIAKSGDRPCDAQTWPYLEAKCLAQPSKRPVRVVTAPRTEMTDAPEDASAAAIQARAAAAPDRATLPPELTSGTAVLYQSQAPAPSAKT